MDTVEVGLHPQTQMKKKPRGILTDIDWAHLREVEDDG